MARMRFSAIRFTMNTSDTGSSSKRILLLSGPLGTTVVDDKTSIGLAVRVAMVSVSIAGRVIVMLLFKWPSL